LGDPESNYMDKDQFSAFLAREQGDFEGIGALLSFDTEGKPLANVGPGGIEPDALLEEHPEAARIPRVVVKLVVPGGPADKAGVRAGDWVESVDGNWVVNQDEFDAFRKQQAKDGATPSPKLLQMGQVLRKKLEHLMYPRTARNELMLGTSGQVSVVWHRGDQLITTTIAKAPSKLGTEDSGQDYTLRFRTGAADELRRAIAGKASVTLDLRNDFSGDFESMRRCLAELAPSGDYGKIVQTRDGKQTSHELAVEHGNARPPKISLLVNGLTSGAAEVFAEALHAKGLATIKGGPMSGDRSVVETVTLPEGCGYTLRTGEFAASGGKS